MKNLLVLLIALTPIHNLSCQVRQLSQVGNCDHEDFSTYDNTSITINNCVYDIYQETPTTRSVANWKNFSGNAQINASALSSIDYYVVLDATPDNYGSSIFTSVPIQNNFGYTFKVLAMAPEGSGEIDVHGENNLPEEHYNCHDIIYDPGQELATFTISSSTFTVYSLPYSQVTFPTSSDPYYSQVYVSPKYRSGTSPYKVNMKYIELCPDCSSTRTYTSQAPAYATTFGYIYMQSPLGTTDKATIDANQNTIFNAYQQVELDPNTEITPASSGSFVAEIISCPSGSQGSSIKTTPVAQNSIFGSLKNINAVYSYPNPVHSVLNIALDNDQKNFQSLRVMNSLGTIVRTVSGKTNKVVQNIQMNVADLNAGTYFIQIQTKDKTYTQKIVKD